MQLTTLQPVCATYILTLPSSGSHVANLPGELLRDCISAASTLGAFLCGFELEAASDGRPVCSAIDLMPNMARYERELQDELALRIANALLGRARAFGHQ